MTARILLVDDDPIARSICAQALKAQGCHVTTIGSAAEALECIRSDGFDVVISDVMMPDMDGIDLGKAIRRDAQFADLDLMFVTALDDRETRIRVLEVADTILTKPVDVLELYLCIDRLVRRRAYVRALSEHASFASGTGLRSTYATEADGLAVGESAARESLRPAS